MMRVFLMRVLAFAASAKIFAASSDYERYGSQAWSSARSNERATDYNSRSSANSNSSANTRYSSAEMAAIARAFNPPRAPENNRPQPVYNNPSASASRPPAPSEEQQHLASAKAGNAEAMVWLGSYYYTNAADKKIALGWYEAAGRTGHDLAMTYAYSMLMEDRFGLKNVPRAMEWLKKLADLGKDPEWASRYAWHLWNGAGVPPDKALAFQYRLKAATHPRGTVPDRILVAESYAAGEGVEKNPLQAIEWYRRATTEYTTETSSVVLPLVRLLDEHAGGTAKNQAEIAKLFTQHTLIAPENSFYFASLKDTGELPPRDMKVARDNYAYVLGFQPNLVVTEPQINPLRQAAAKRLMELCLRGEGGPVDRAAARAAGLFALKAGDASYRPLALGYLLVDPALGEPEKDWAVKIFDAHPDDLEALRECAHLTKNLSRMRKLVERGDGDAARFLATFERYYVIRLDPEGKPQGYREKSREWAAKGAALANLDCLSFQGAWLVEDARVTKQPDVAAAMVAEGVACLKKAAESKHPLGMTLLGESYRDGEGVERNPAEAFGWFKKSADLGNNRGKSDLAMALYSGAGAPADKPAALKLIGEAAPELRDAAAAYGLWLWRGDCGPPDVAEGGKWMDAALKADYWLAGRNLAKFYHLGSGVPKDEQRARAYLIKAAEVGDKFARQIVAEAFEKGEIIDKDEREADERFEQLGGGLAAAHFLRQGDKNKAMWFVLYGGDKADPEIIRVGAELKKDQEAMVAAELPRALPTLDKTLARLETAAAGFKPTGERTSFFKYEVNVGSNANRLDRDDDYKRIKRMPESPERDLVLGARDATLVGEGDFEAAIIAQQGYYAGDPVRGPRFLAAIKKIAVADAERGDVAAMAMLARLSCPIHSEEMMPFWERDDREAIRWCRRALLAGNRDSVWYVEHFYSEQAEAAQAPPARRQQWKTLCAELEKISDDDPNRAALIADCTRKFLPPE